MMSQWRRLALSKQGLVSQPKFGDGLSGTRKAIEHLGYVQIDTLSVVERAHHHVLWNRVPSYDSTHLNQLISEQHIFEYWYHAASYLPMRDYRYALPNMASIRHGDNRYYTNVDNRLMKEILARVNAEGELRLRDLDKEKKTKKDSWWGTGAAKRALETLFMQGDLMVCRRDGMEKVYDLTERCLPETIDLSVPTLSEYATYLFDTTLRAHGVFTWKQLLHLKPGKPLRDAMRQIVDERMDAGVIRALDALDAPTTYVDANEFGQAGKISRAVNILSPFDNVVIHRDRLSSLFKFDYRIECYVSAPKRVFGYFCLPILYGDTFVGRIDCKAHRADRRFEVLSLSLEDGEFDRELFFPALRKELKRLADFNQCPLLDMGLVAVEGA